MLLSAPISPEDQDKIENKLKHTNLQWIKVRNEPLSQSQVLKVSSVFVLSHGCLLGGNEIADAYIVSFMVFFLFFLSVFRAFF